MKLTPSLLEFPDELLAVQALDLDLIRLDWGAGRWLLVFFEHVVGVPEVLLEISQGLPLAKHPWHFLQPTDVPVLIHPILERECCHTRIMP